MSSEPRTGWLLLALSAAYFAALLILRRPKKSGREPYEAELAEMLEQHSRALRYLDGMKADTDYRNNADKCVDVLHLSEDWIAKHLGALALEKYKWEGSKRVFLAMPNSDPIVLHARLALMGSLSYREENLAALLASAEWDGDKPLRARPKPPKVGPWKETKWLAY